MHNALPTTLLQFELKHLCLTLSNACGMSTKTSLNLNPSLNKFIEK